MADKIVLINKGILSTGTYSFGPFNIQNNIDKIIVTVLRDGWPDIGSNVVKVDTEITLDDGDTWGYWTGFTAIGGQSTNPVTGLPHNTSGFGGILPVGIKRKIRGTVQLFTDLNIELSVLVS